MSSQNIQPNDLVLVIDVPNAWYAGPCQPGAVGTVVGLGKPPRFDQGGKYWDVSFPDGGVHVHERVLRKIDGEGRKVGRWDYCVFNAPKRHAELERVRAE